MPRGYEFFLHHSMLLVATIGIRGWNSFCGSCDMLFSLHSSNLRNIPCVVRRIAGRMLLLPVKTQFQKTICGICGNIFVWSQLMVGFVLIGKIPFDNTVVYPWIRPPALSRSQWKICNLLSKNALDYFIEIQLVAIVCLPVLLARSLYIVSQ